MVFVQNVLHSMLTAGANRECMDSSNNTIVPGEGPLLAEADVS